MNIRILGITAPVVLAVTALTAQAQAGAHGRPPGASQAREDGRAEALFRTKCLSCHQAPDLRFPVDRAWLNQVRDTA